MSICVHELALGCTLKTPLFLAVRLPNREFFSRASARFHPPAAAKKGNLHITKGSPPLNLAELAATMLKVLCGVMNESVKAVYIFIQRISSSQNSRIRIRALVRFAGAMHVLLRELKVKL